MTVVAPSPTRPSNIRLTVCVAAVAACVPYALLKIAWIAGSDIGIADAEAAAQMHGAEFRIGNAITLGLELGAVAIVTTLTFARRMPAIAVLGPIWVGSGLLAPFVIALPLGLAVQAVAGGSPAPDDGGLNGWVFAVVYGGFILQALFLTAAFLLHAVTRWAWAFRLQADDVSPGPTYALQRLMAGTGIIVAAFIATVHVLWAADPGAFGGPDAFDTAAQRTFLLVGGLIPFGGALGVLALVRRRRGGSLRLPLATAWIGSAAAFVAPLLPAASQSRFEAFVDAVGGMTGVALAITALLVLIEARAAER